MYSIQTGIHMKITVEDLNPRSDRTVLLLHGWPFNRKLWEYQASLLPGLGYRTVTMDLRGFGTSDVTSEPYSYDHLAQDLHQVIQRLGARKIALVGFGIGGAAAIRCLSLFQEPRVVRLLLLGVPAQPDNAPASGGISPGQFQELLARALTNRPEMVRQYCSLLFSTPPGEAMQGWLEQLALEASGVSTLGALKMLREETLTADLSAVRIPAAVFHGKQDRICPFTGAQEAARLLGSARLIPFADCGHLFFYEQRELFHRELLCFLQEMP